MASIFSLFVGLPIFLTLPGPFKFFIMMLASVSFFGVRNVEVKQAQAHVEIAPAAPAPIEEAPELVAPKVAPKQAAPLKISMDINGEFTVGGEKFSEAALTKKLKTMVKANAQQKVLLEADARAPLQVITNAMKIVKSSGITNVSYAAKASISPVDPPESP